MNNFFFFFFVFVDFNVSFWLEYIRFVDGYEFHALSERASSTGLARGGGKRFSWFCMFVRVSEKMLGVEE